MKSRHGAFGLGLAACLVLLPFVESAQGSTVGDKKPRYVLASGKGWTICETYVKFLNALPTNEELLTCDLKLKHVPGMREPDWQEMNIAKNLNVVHQIEMLLGIGHIEPEPDKDFERWKIQREARMRANGEQPRLRRARLALVVDGPVETVLSYNYDIQMCEKQVKVAKEGKPYAHRLGEPNFFVFDEAKQRVMGSGLWVNATPGELAVFQGKPYFIELGFGDYDPNGGASGSLFVRRLKPVLVTPLRLYEWPDDPLYGSHELCRIRFDHPFPRFNPPLHSR